MKHQGPPEQENTTEMSICLGVQLMSANYINDNIV